MSGVLLHDGRAGGHRKWSREAVQAGCASGVIVNPFSTPRVSQERNPSASTLATDMDDLDGDFIFDPMTHSRMLATTNKLDFYDQWELWPNPTPALTTAVEYLDHVERVFQRQSALSAPFLARRCSCRHRWVPKSRRHSNSLGSHVVSPTRPGSRWSAHGHSGRLALTWTPM